MRQWRWLLLISLAAGCARCNAESAPASKGDSGVGGTGRGSDDCATAADCDAGACIEIIPDGRRLCARIPPTPTGCAHCSAGESCYEHAGLPDGKVCLRDECTSDRDCGDYVDEPPHIFFLTESDEAADAGPPKPSRVRQMCVPAGTLGWPVRTCVPAFCRINDDCSEMAGGGCELIAAGPISIYSVWKRPMQGLACVYPGRGCMSDDDCSGAKHTCRIYGDTRASACSRWSLPHVD
jgi:hypothetical protein